MEFSMSANIRKQLKIFWPVIINDAVNVMYNLFGLEISTDCSFHNQMRTFFVPTLSRKWMFRHENKDIPRAMYSAATFPVPSFLSFYLLLCKAYFCFAFLRDRMSSRLSSLQGFANFTVMFSCSFIDATCHNILQIKKTAFGVLKRTQQSVQRLLTAYNFLGITVFSLAHNDYISNFRKCNRKTNTRGTK